VEGEEGRQNNNDEQHHKDKEEWGQSPFLLNKYEKGGIMGYDKPGVADWKSSLIEADLNQTFLKVAQSTSFQSSISSIWVWRILYHDHECNKTIYIQSMHLLKLPYLSVFLEI